VTEDEAERRHLKGLQAVNFASALDRSVIGPMLLVMAADLGASLAEITVVASAYYLTYGLMQPVWGLVSARIGTVRTLRIALLGAAVFGTLSALSPSVPALAALRALAGGFFGGAIPATLVYVGATVPVERRQKPLTQLMAGVAVGTAVATAAAGWAAQYVSWRWPFALTATAGLVLGVYLRRLPEPPRPDGTSGVVRVLLRAVRERWVVLVLTFGFVEGALITGIFTFVAPGIQETIEQGAGVAGSVVAAYGVAVLVFTRVVGRLSARLSTPTLLLTGGAAGALGYTVLAVQRSVVAGVVACVLIGAMWAFMHSTLQTWATSVAPQARAQVVSLFAGSLFLGGSTGAALGGPLADATRYGLLFALSAAVFVPLTLATAVTRKRYLTTRRGR
jgi:predicted MFS family arabinose efflux permease